jgi:hypothetical protein
MPTVKEEDDVSIDEQLDIEYDDDSLTREEILKR